MSTKSKPRREGGTCSFLLPFARDGGRRGGYTLVEVMVVVAIIIILVSMLMPFLDGIRERGYVSLCQNNLEKISQAMGTSSSNAGGRRPTDAGWILAATAYGSKEILVCPKGSYRGGSSSVDLTGDVKVIPPPDMGKFSTNPAIESNKTIWMWQERQAYSLPSSVTADIVNPGRYDNSYNSNSGTIPGGTVVDCYFLHFDPVGSTNTSTGGQVIKFSDEILGIICTSGALDATDDVLGDPGTAYSKGVGARGFENNAEQVTLSADRNSFVIHNFSSSYPGEEVRILTRPGGQASYGINLKVNDTMANPDQIYIVEYERSQINIDDPKWSAYTAPRHFKKSNALMVDGSVRLLSPEDFDRDKGHWRP
jgi:type II secretory pathway pseudopilin PulG